MTGIVLAAALVTLVVLTASAVAWRSWKTDWTVFSAFMAGLPLSYLVNKFVKPPVILSIQRLAWPSAESPAPMTFALLILWVAPFVEEAAKLLPLAIPWPARSEWGAHRHASQIAGSGANATCTRQPSPPCVDEDGPAPAGHRDVPSARLRNTPYKFKPSSSTSSASKSFRFGMAAGFGFGLGEAWYLAWGIARTPGYGSLRFSSHHGYIAERLVVTFAHGVMTALAVSRLPRPSGRPLLRYSGSDFARLSVCGYMQAVFLHVLVNAGPLFYQAGIIGTVGYTMFTLASIAALVIVFMRLRSS